MISGSQNDGKKEENVREKLLMITRRGEKIKPFIIENSSRGKIFLLKRREGRVKDLKGILSFPLVKLILSPELKDCFGANKLRAFCPESDTFIR